MQPEQQQNNQVNQPSPQVSHSPSSPISHSQMEKRPGLFKKILMAFFILILLAGIGGAGYMYYEEKQAHDDTKNQLAELNDSLKDSAQVLQDARLEPGFRKELQDGANRGCSSKSAILFNTTTSPEKREDGSIKQFFAVGQYVCNNGEQVASGPVRFVAVQSHDEATWKFTYGSNGAHAVSLPGYIFNTDPLLFNRKYNNPDSF